MTTRTRPGHRPAATLKDFDMTAIDTEPHLVGTAGRNPRRTVADLREEKARFQRRVSYGFLALGVIAVAVILAFLGARLEVQLEGRLAAGPAHLRIMEAERLLLGGASWQNV